MLLVSILVQIFSPFLFSANANLKQSPASKQRAPNTSSSRLAEEFARQVGFTPGLYEAQNDPTESCPYGRAYFIEIDGVLMFRIDELTVFDQVRLGRHRVRYNEGNCSIDLTVEQSGSRVISTKNQVCPNGRFKFENEVRFSSRSLTYKTKSSTNGNQTLSMTCEMDLKE